MDSFRKLCIEKLGDQADEAVIDDVINWQKSLQCLVKDTIEKYESSDMSDTEYVTGVNLIASLMFARISAAVGCDNFKSIFGAEAENMPEIVNLEEFKMANRELSMASLHQPLPMLEGMRMVLENPNFIYRKPFSSLGLLQAAGQ